MISLKALPQCTGKYGVVGFCYGGSISNFLATRLPDLGASVPFYGGQAPAEDAVKIKAPLMLQYAEKDERVNAGWPVYEAALKANEDDAVSRNEIKYIDGLLAGKAPTDSFMTSPASRPDQKPQ